MGILEFFVAITVTKLICVVGACLLGIVAIEVEKETHLMEDSIKVGNEALRNLLEGLVTTDPNIEEVQLEEMTKSVEGGEITAVLSETIAVRNARIYDILNAAYGRPKITPVINSMTDGSSALKEESRVQAGPWANFEVIEGGGKGPDKKPDIDLGKVVSLGLTAKLVEAINKQINSNKQDASEIIKVIDLGDVVQVTYGDGTIYSYQKDDIPIAELKWLEEKSKGGGGSGAGDDYKKGTSSSGTSEESNNPQVNYSQEADGSVSLIKGDNTGVSEAKTLVDKGEQFANGRKNKLKPDIRYQTGEFDYFYETDSSGRLTKFETDDLQLTTREERLPHSKNTPGKIKGEDHAGHLAGDIFGGSPKIDNLVSQLSEVNLSQYKKIEYQWKEAIRAGKKVKVKVEIIYEGSSLRPLKFIIKYTIDGEAFSVPIKN